MLRRLRRRFVAVVMALVGTLVIAMVGISYANSQASLYAIVSRSLDMALEQRSEGEGNKDAGMGMRHLPILWIDLSYDGVKLGSNEAELSIDTNDLATVMGEVVSSDRGDGRLEGSHLSWRRASTLGGFRVAIADTTSIDEEKTSQLMKSALLAVIGMAVTFGLAEALARWAVRPVQLAWDQQHQFVADASHELKTPLAVILADTEILLRKKGELDESTLRWVESAHDEAEHMRGLVEEMLELARTEDAAGSKRDNVRIDLSDTVERETLEFDAVAFERGTSIESSIDPGLCVMGDASQLSRLVKTLIENACKYAPKGSSVTVSLSRRAGMAELSVTNGGDPIPAEDLPHVFDRFWRSDKARTRETGGYGLGLAIAKGIAESHSGKIEVTSTAEAGTTFTVRLPEARD
ncbi:HAMP domain-containing sensor histidine kinase [uncultured Parolsenella sp.]|uniref:sensor histidine kinase n=1 Tax=uncultured Parolsenella sp. TaxID=2083008 RepID=UPI0025D1E05B|nr:HAMP domain-containing sensor histidine kinase [uncultured Parolsenella sp.]